MAHQPTPYCPFQTGIPRLSHATIRPLVLAGMTTTLPVGAGHAVVRTLYSRARRIGYERSSCFLRSFKKSASPVVGLVAVVAVFLKPGLEVIVFPKQEL